MAPATRKTATLVPKEGIESEAAPSTRPTAHDASTTSRVRLGPVRSTRRPQPRLASTATIVSSSRDEVGLLLREADGADGEDAHDHDHRVHRVGVEEAAQQEAAQAGHGPRVVDGARHLA